jgi:signal transduction histidine kinase
VRALCEGHHDLQEVCHDLRQTVAAVRTLADAALADDGLQGAARTHVEKLVGQAEILADTVRQQLRPAPGDQWRRRLFDLRRLIGDLVDAERVTYHGELDLQAGQAPVLVHAQPADARRVFVNLLSNATRAAGPAGRVMIEMRVEDGLAEVSMDNTGPTRAGTEEGTGLGWDIITQRLSRIEGRLVYGPGRCGGVRATVRLPLASVF